MTGTGRRPLPAWAIALIVFAVVLVIAVAVASCGPAADGGGGDRKPEVERAVSAKTPPPAAAPRAMSPVFRSPVPGDFHPSLKLITKRCFGVAGCNLSAVPRLGWTLNLDPTRTYAVSYEIRGVDDGPVIGTFTGIRGQEYDIQPEELLSTPHTSVKPVIVVTGVEES